MESAKPTHVNYSNKESNFKPEWYEEWDTKLLVHLASMDAHIAITVLNSHPVTNKVDQLLISNIHGEMNALKEVLSTRHEGSYPLQEMIDSTIECLAENLSRYDKYCCRGKEGRQERLNRLWELEEERLEGQLSPRTQAEYNDLAKMTYASLTDSYIRKCKRLLGKVMQGKATDAEYRKCLEKHLSHLRKGKHDTKRFLNSVYIPKELLIQAGLLYSQED